MHQTRVFHQRTIGLHLSFGVWMIVDSGVIRNSTFGLGFLPRTWEIRHSGEIRKFVTYANVRSKEVFVAWAAGGLSRDALLTNLCARGTGQVTMGDELPDERRHDRQRNGITAVGEDGDPRTRRWNWHGPGSSLRNRCRLPVSIKAERLGS
jgi:hypothetical protein